MTIVMVFVLLGLLAFALIIYLAKGHLGRGGDLETFQPVTPGGCECVLQFDFGK